MQQPQRRHQAALHGKAWEGLRLRIGSTQASVFLAATPGWPRAAHRRQSNETGACSSMSTAKQLRLVTDAPPAHHAHETHAPDPTRQVFEHWVFMFGLQPGRTKLDAERRQAVNSALALYSLDLVLLAVEGMAAVPMGDKPQSMREAMRELSWFLASAKRIERCFEYGDQVRAMLASAPPSAQAEADRAAPVDPVVAAAARQRLRDLAEQCRGVRG